MRIEIAVLGAPRVLRKSVFRFGEEQEKQIEGIVLRRRNPGAYQELTKLKGAVEFYRFARERLVGYLRAEGALDADPATRIREAAAAKAEAEGEANLN